MRRAIAASLLLSSVLSRVLELDGETFDKLLTEVVSPLWVDPILNRPTMFVCRSRTGQEDDLED